MTRKQAFQAARTFAGKSYGQKGEAVDLSRCSFCQACAASGAPISSPTLIGTSSQGPPGVNLQGTSKKRQKKLRPKRGIKP
jgi:hypothetical protein